MSNTITATAGTATAAWDTKKHPAGLYVLFFTEMWERFSYYGMRALLVYYMTKHLMFTQEKSSQIYGLYTGFVYFTPFFGGMLADRFLGQRKTVILGGVLMAIGHFLMAFESLFFPALFFLILGNGAFKPNISTQVGNLYPAGDKRRDSAFSIFYMGINLGAFFSPLVCGTLGEVYGFHYGFGAAGVGMVIGLLIYLWGQKHLAADNIMKKAAAGQGAKGDAGMLVEALTKDDKSKILALVVLCLFNIVFWATYEQQGNTLALWADANTDRMIFGWEMPASWFQSFNPAMIFAFTPIITGFWARQAQRGKEPSSIAKMAIGCFLLGASFLIMIPATHSYASGQKASMGWLTACTFLLTLGELYLSPVGLSLVTKLAPVRMVSMLMGMWFLSSFFGNYLSGFIGMFWEKMSKENFFILLSVLSFAAGFAFLAVLNPLKRAIGHGKEATVDV
ncbi:MAG: peptide MFS transporter [Oligoflexia bacterium]|nr:peptide MFS transporter [Oligoflexia bacterium]